MESTTNYALKVYEGTDLFNPLTVENVNTEALDLIIKSISDQAVGTATELTTGTVHALTRSDSDQALFRFTATSNFASGDTFTVDTIQVTALTINGQTLPDGAYLAGAEVLCALVGTRLTVYGVTGSTTADNALKLGGELPSYYGKATDVTLAQNTANAAGLLAQQLDGRVQALEQTGTGLKPTVLWSNPSPAAAFPAQSVTLSDSLANYDFVEVVYITSSGSGFELSTGLLRANASNTVLSAILATNYYRFFNIANASFLDATVVTTYGGNGTVNNNYIVPIQIIGFKR